MRNRFEIKRVLFINGVRVKLFGQNGTHSPTMKLLDEMEACHVHKNPWGDFLIEDFTVKAVISKNGGGVYARYDVKTITLKSKIG